MESRFGLSEVTPVGVPRQEQVVVVGRVCCESAEGKINRASILLEVRRWFDAGCVLSCLHVQTLSHTVEPGHVASVCVVAGGAAR